MHEEMIHRASPWYIDGLTAILRSPLSMKSSSAYIKSIRIPVSELGKNPTSPPAVVLCGITQGYKFTLNSDKAHYKKAIDDNYAGGDLNMHFHWTKSTTNSDQSGNWSIWYSTASTRTAIPERLPCRWKTSTKAQFRGIRWCTKPVM